MFAIQVLNVLATLVIGLALITVEAKKSKRWTYPRPQWPVPQHRKESDPCKFFIWDVDSAYRFCLCSRLLRHRLASEKALWTDVHDQLWLRLAPNDRLLSMFPCQQYSLRRCCKCGYELSEHFKWRTNKTKARPYEQWLVENASDGNAGRFPDFGEIVKRGTDNSPQSKDASEDGAAHDPRWCYRQTYKRLLTKIGELQGTALLHLSGGTVTSFSARKMFREAEERSRLRAMDAAGKSRVVSGNEIPDGEPIRGYASKFRRKGHGRRRKSGLQRMFNAVDYNEF